MPVKWHAIDEQVLNAEGLRCHRLPLAFGLLSMSVPLAGTLTFRVQVIVAMRQLLPPREELPSPESQSGNILAPPLWWGLFFLANAQIFFLSRHATDLHFTSYATETKSRFPSRL